MRAVAAVVSLPQLTQQVQCIAQQLLEIFQQVAPVFNTYRYANQAVGHTGSHKMRFTASREVSRGGCIVQTRFGIIDARRETKLARVAEYLGEIVGGVEARQTEATGPTARLGSKRHGKGP